MESELASCAGLKGNDHAKATTMPLLQAVNAEVLRLHVGIGMTRVNETVDMNLGGYRITRGQPLLIFSRLSALNDEAWMRAGRSPENTGCLKEFHAGRFSYQRKTKRRGPGRGGGGGGGGGRSSAGSHGMRYSMDGLAGLWLSYGGGQRMCPGRYFAKTEMISMFSILFSQYELELLDVLGSVEVKADLRWFPTGGLAPDRKVPFRVRRRRSI
ncbi:hypothetical protein CDD83_5616 [Cordyceps sp. RAO-2017]|nr:hypothetical protein CDD83_5616 [Cordyceps sp. RAO-2017]